MGLYIVYAMTVIVDALASATTSAGSSFISNTFMGLTTFSLAKVWQGWFAEVPEVIPQTPMYCRMPLMGSVSGCAPPMPDGKAKGGFDTFNFLLRLGLRVTGYG